MAHPDSRLVPAVSMDDEVGIVYLIETVQQFWSGEYDPLGSLSGTLTSQLASELEDVLKLPNTEHQTLILLDAALRRFLSLCSAYHGMCTPPGHYSPQLIDLLRTISADSSSVGTRISDTA